MRQVDVAKNKQDIFEFSRQKYADIIFDIFGAKIQIILDFSYQKSAKNKNAILTFLARKFKLATKPFQSMKYSR